MAKRSKFKRIARDYYRTFDPRAGAALAPHLAPDTKFIEPCAGAFDLAAQLVLQGHTCMAATDIEPMIAGVGKADARKLQPQPHLIITNPPWSRPLLHELILHFVSVAPAAWLLFDASWFHTEQARRYLEHCTDVVSIGRMIWIPGTKSRGKDDVCWYRFAPGQTEGIRAWPQR